MQKALIVGAGIAGLATSIRLAQKGYEVHVYESNSYAGGKLTSFQKEGYRFDAGPSLFTSPHLVTELFELAGEKPEDFFEYRRMDNICNYFWEDGTRFSMPAKRSEQIDAIHNAFSVSKKKIQSYLERNEQKYKLTAPLFIERSLHKFSSFWDVKVMKALMKMHKLDTFKTLHQLNNEQFQNKKLVQLMDRFATYNGSSPYKTSGIMSMIPHLEMDGGTYFPEGGMHSITQSLLELARRQGVEFHFEMPVEEVTHKEGRITGIRAKGQNIEGDLVVINADIYTAYEKLIRNVKKPEKILKQERSSSALIFYWGIKRTFEELDLHNILFSDSYEEEFDFIFNKKQIHDDPTIYVNISSKENKADAPDGCENWFVMINTPSDQGQNWSEMIEKARKDIIHKINRILGIDIGTLIQCEEILYPGLIASKTSSHQGALYGTSSNSRYAAFLRHANFSGKIKNLYFCGGSVHPGGGIPLCLNSAKIVSNFIA